MPSYKLYYFDARGRGEIARWLFAQAGQEYEDARVGGETWAKKKPDTPFGQLPVLEVTDDAGKVHKIAQSNAVFRYLANEFGLRGKTNLDQAKGDMLGEHMADIMKAMPYTEKDPEKKKKLMEEAFAGPIANGLEKLEKYVCDGGFFLGSEVSLVDFSFACGVEMMLLSGNQTFLDKTPKLKALNERVRSLPKIAAWIAKRPKTNF